MKRWRSSKIIISLSLSACAGEVVVVSSLVVHISESLKAVKNNGYNKMFRMFYLNISEGS